MSYGNQAVLASAATLIVPTSTAAGGACGLVYNGGGNTIYVAEDASVTTANGMPVAPGQSYRFVNVSKGLWGIAAVADQVSPADTRWNHEHPRPSHY